jgi:hypothetical protein
MIPIIFEWDGESMVPLTRFNKRCNDQFVVGERYTLVVSEDRSAVSHRHFFATVTEAWHNLPEDLAERFPTSDHLRKYALIRAGFRDERSFACHSGEEARRLASFIKPMDDFAVVTVSESLVCVYTAKSQSLKSMGKKDFQASKDAVLRILSELIGTDATTLRDNVGKAA